VRNVASTDSHRRLAALKIAADWLLGDYRLSWHQLDWWHDPDFNAYLDRFGEKAGYNTHRKWTLWQLLRLCSSIPGDTAECGVFQGASSWLICVANRSRPGHTTHHLFDSFEGLSAPTAHDGDYWQAGIFATPESLVAEKLHPFAGEIEFHKGWIPDRFPEVAERRFAFVHVDVDLFQPTLASVEFFYDRMNDGAILLCDDYGCSTCPGATRAIDEYLADKPEKMISLDGGGGFFIRGRQTGARRSPLVGR
jgi:hypothetical protein